MGFVFCIAFHGASRLIGAGCGVVLVARSPFGDLLNAVYLGYHIH